MCKNIICIKLYEIQKKYKIVKKIMDGVFEVCMHLNHGC